MVISASWLSRTNGGDGTLNLRGVATVLALAKFLKRMVSKPDLFLASQPIRQNTLYGQKIWYSLSAMDIWMECRLG
jgi:phosphohistidine phosphatase SixA